jgi:hypothetical protein
MEALDRLNRSNGWGKGKTVRKLLRTPRSGLTGLGLILGAVACLAQNGTEGPQSYFEFGTVVALGTHTLELQAFDARTRKIVQHSFMRTRETHQDPLKVGDQVEVIFTAHGGEWTARRLLLLPAGIPSSGPAPGGPPLETASAGPAAPTMTSSVAAVGNSRTKNRGDLPPAPVVRVARPPSAVALGARTVPKVAPITSVPLGISAGYSTPAPVPVTRTIAREQPTAACHQSDPEWPTQPLRIAVLDFRYPTEREEAHDITKQSGGSGMAVADQVYTRLTQLPQYAVDRGDRRRLDRSDIAGAARLGRELGADAVLEGTFFPIEGTPDPDGSPGRLSGYELHAGLVDTCTGQVLLKLASVNCPSGESIGAKACTPVTLTPRDAEDPDAHAAAFNAAITALLFPLEHNGGSVGTLGSAGVVVLSQNGRLTVRLPDGFAIRPGQQLAVHASRLTKNPTTYTLEDLHDQEIGRFTVQSVQGPMATGTFVGDRPALVGDALEPVSN